MAVAPAESRAALSTPVTARVLPHGVEGQGREVERDAIEDDGSALAVTAAQRVGKDGSGERKERDNHQQKGVQEQYNSVGGADVVEHDVVVRPHVASQRTQRITTETSESLRVRDMSAGHRSSTTSSCGREQQMSALPSAGGSTGSGL